ncbi:MAG TPA: carboxyl transferase domain-containing protein [Mycobacteriales bacterium]|nr:carboxyl transferase domain-containing protein [Mycobacteriales bacterium]HWC34183.1 carboxyl transferase domain-containing protein [Mycobacteriales bacterium]
MTALDVAPTTVSPPVVDLDRDPRLRLSALLGDWRQITTGSAADCGVIAGIGRVDGAEVVAFATDASLQGGALGAAGCAVIVEAYDLAMRHDAAIVGIWHSGGARLAEGVASLDGVGRIFTAMTHASGRIPQVSVVLGPAAGGAAYGPALTDVVVLGPAGRVFVTGPDVVRSVTGEDVDMEQLGGPDAHGRKSGVVHLVAPTDASAIATAGEVAGLLAARRTRVTPAADRPMADLLPHSPRRAYDVRPIVRTLLDDPGIELHPKWAPNITTTLGRLGGGPVGVLANNPLRLAGCLDSASAEKAARFVRMCNAFGIPLVVLVDVPGYLPGVRQEWDGVVRRGAKLLHAFAEATVPRVTVVTRKAYGGAYIAMNSRSLGATKVFAWPSAEVAVMGSIAAVRILHRRTIAAVPEAERAELEIALAAEHEAKSGGVARAVDLDLVDAVIDPDTTRSAVSAAIAGYPRQPGNHRNIPL